MMQMLIEALRIPVIRHAFLGMLVAGATLSLLGVVIVSLHLTAIRFTLMHVGLFGAAAGMALGFSPTVGAFTVVILASLVMGMLAKDKALSASSISGLFMTGSLAGAFLLLASTGVPAMQVFDIFAGNILMLGTQDLWLTVCVALVIVATFIIAFREIQLVLLNRELARTLGVPVDKVMVMLFLLLGLGIATALRLVGALLVDAIILLPGIAALRFARSFTSALILSVLFGIVTTMGGFLVALSFNLPVGASAAMVATLLLGCSLLATRILRI
jgi:zinc transport system permease protein